MGQQFVTERPYQRIYIDFMGPYPRSKTGYTVIFVCLDHFSKFVHLEPMRAATAVNVVNFLEKDVFHIFGVPEYVHSDNGRQFTSDLFQDFLRKYGVNHIRTGLYAPQSNAAERVNRSILQMIRSYIGKDQRHWDQHLSEVAFALRSGYHSSIGVAPYYALFGIDMVQHASKYDIIRNIGSLKDIDFTIDNTPDRLQIIRDNIFENLKLAHDRSTKNYNLRAKDIKFQKGQMVYRKNYKLSKKVSNFNSKLAPTRIKCIVLETLGNSLYKLGGLDGKVMGVFHGQDLFAV